jgi:hypothetical protein
MSWFLFPCPCVSFLKNEVPLSPQPLALLIETGIMFMCPVMHRILDLMSLHLQFCSSAANCNGGIGFSNETN